MKPNTVVTRRPDAAISPRSSAPAASVSSVSPLATVRASVEQEFASLRESQPRLFQLALNEAEAIAWSTGFPELFFPTLALEKARALAAWQRRQKGIRQTQSCLAFAA